ncbi:AraC family transcriptional regulator [Pseudomaricurvus alkylphenolicus]|uniref:AraC family transcriptional regulator n=1 Tax=Pseudomaricurvus alkylphenolicus TaxID=1306991 RepID=UPI001420B849|nr:AraC family transcriptional regulator [Pseudomaricurvus alkylphenolicus]NIB40810.1 AraC family transcriptional regulator [Pseudomaricurvus alkylphenolicus]
MATTSSNNTLSSEDSAYGSSISGWALAVARALDTYGIDSKSVFREAGIELERVFSSQSRVPVARMQNVWKHAAERLEQDDFGYSVAANLTPASFHGLSFGLYASQTLLELLERLIRYRRVISCSYNLRLDDRNDSIILTFDDQRQVKSAGPSVTVILYLLRICREIYGPGFAPLKVFFQLPASAASQQLQDFVNAPIDYDAPCNGLVLSKEVALRPLPGANAELGQHQDRLVEQYLARSGLEDTLRARVKLKVLDALANGGARLEDLAEAFHMTPRTLQRKLKKEECSYHDLLDESRKQLALEFAEDPHMSATQIALSLGFADTATFARAFKRWTGESLTAYRQQSEPSG